MMYFTIPQDVLSVGNPVADTDVYLDDGVQIPTTSPVREVLFGDDYSLTIPLGSRNRVFGGNFSNRSTTTADLIDSYFEYLEGEPINNFHILDVAATVVVLQWSKSFRAGDVSSVQAQFKEVTR